MSGDSCHLLSIGVMYPIVGFPVQERYELPGLSRVTGMALEHHSPALKLKELVQPRRSSKESYKIL